MSDQDQSASQLKQQQRIDWDAAAAGWKQWWSTFERAAQHVSDRLVDSRPCARAIAWPTSPPESASPR